MCSVYYGLNQLGFCSAVSLPQASYFHNEPQVFYGIEVWRTIRPFQHFHFHFFETICNNLGLVTWGRVLLKNVLRMKVSPFEKSTSFNPSNIQTEKMFWRCLSVNGPGALEPIEGMMNRTYWPIIERRVSRELANFYPQSIFQQDSAPRHKAKIITNCFKKVKMEVLKWPGNSLDLNAIENLWSTEKNC